MENENITVTTDTAPEANVEGKKSPEPKAPESGQKKDEQKEPSIQELMLEIAKQKRSIDKLTHENADLTKKYRATLSEQEVANMEKAEAEAAKQAEFDELKKQVKVNEYEKTFVLMNYTAEQAHDAAVAQYENDFETLSKIQQEVMEASLKQKEAEWLKSRPEINAGGDNGEPEDLFLKGFASVPTRFGR